MPEIQWQHSATITACDNLKEIIDDDDLELTRFKPENISAPKGWEVNWDTKWGRWHVIRFNVNEPRSIIIIWRRCIRKKE